MLQAAVHNSARRTGLSAGKTRAIYNDAENGARFHVEPVAIFVIFVLNVAGRKNETQLNRRDAFKTIRAIYTARKAEGMMNNSRCNGL